MLIFLRHVLLDLFVYLFCCTICCLAYFQDLEILALPFGLSLIALIPFLFTRLSILFRFPRMASSMAYLLPWILWYGLLILMYLDQAQRELSDGSGLILKSILISSVLCWIPASWYFWKSTNGFTLNRGVVLPKQSTSLPSNSDKVSTSN